MSGKIKFEVKRRVGKTQPGVADVHAPTALGNQRSRARARDFLTVIGEIAGGARVVQLPTQGAPAMVGKGGTKDGTMTFTFIRHGSTRMNNHDDTSKDRIRGWTNVPLNEDGIKDAEKAGKKLSDSGIKIIVHSDLDRSAQTAKIVNKEGELGAKLVPTPKLRPWDLGDFTGTPTKEAMPKIAAYILEKPDEPVPNGESFNDFRARHFSGIQYAVKKAGRSKLGVVAHYRNERMLSSWDAAGQPADHSIDLDEFTSKGDAPGGIMEFSINRKRLFGEQDDDHAVASGDGGADLGALEDGGGDVGKVYDSNADLPDNVTNVLPGDAQTVFRRVFNDSVKGGKSEDSARRIAWTAVKNGWRKGDDGQWVRKFAGDVESLIVFTDQQIALAKQLPSDAVQGPGAPAPNNASLQLFPLDSDPAWAKTPFPWDHNALGKVKPDQMKPLLGALTNQDALPVKTVHMKTVVALQDRVNPDKVQSMVNDEPDDLPLVVKLNGRNLILDGHHRMTARYLIGRKTAQVRFMNLDTTVAQDVEDDKELRGGVKKRAKPFFEALMGWLSKAGPPDEARDASGRWTTGGGDQGVALHVTELKAAGLNDQTKFDRAHASLAGDKSMSNEDLKNVIRQYTDSKNPAGKTRSDHLDQIRQSWVRMSRFENKLKHDDGFSRAFEVKKIDEDQQLVFGWASISSVDGEYVVDKQDDIIPEDELEKAAYDFVLYHRSQGDMHERMGVGRCVESMMFTKQKQDALCIDLGLVGWWIGFKVDDQDVWKRIKGGDLPEFSIGGKATREAA